ncbi:1-aminocyclopropane-1-carboxylate oxidase-like protein 11 [Hibiscus syriacus]|uniref:1-aminocyclopropane-1-carboxylate oxidase-like protein 11 n=1 Tax=Hibiscus syriacus TaxID=106335 RepID=A0A6A3D2J8_HIBSY|nr:1-aminocyclopropane-1-carboxylate oxidase-like protein 11 [Hibiscus syriacus]
MEAKNLGAHHIRTKEIKTFFESREGVKGLVDSGITEIPGFFIQPPETFPANCSTDATLTARLQFPVIDLEGFESKYVGRHPQGNDRNMKQIVQLKETLSELLSEALGLRRNYLGSIGGMEGALIACHYHPPCPQPELTLGTSSHIDAPVLTILLEDNIDGLQVVHQNQWVDVPHLHGYLTANIGYFLLIVSNDKFKSVTHRVLAGRVGPRISAACFFAPTPSLRDKPYGAADELLSEENPPIYRGTSFHHYVSYFRECHMIKWERPPRDWVKVNTDGPVQGVHGDAFAGGSIAIQRQLPCSGLAQLAVIKGTGIPAILALPDEVLTLLQVSRT